jgi:hypothetical protein
MEKRAPDKGATHKEIALESYPLLKRNEIRLHNLSDKGEFPRPSPQTVIDCFVITLKRISEFTSTTGMKQKSDMRPRWQRSLRKGGSVEFTRARASERRVQT